MHDYKHVVNENVVTLQVHQLLQLIRQMTHLAQSGSLAANQHQVVLDLVLRVRLPRVTVALTVTSYDRL